MKKIIWVLLVLLTACGSSPKDFIVTQEEKAIMEKISQTLPEHPSIVMRKGVRATSKEGSFKEINLELIVEELAYSTIQEENRLRLISISAYLFYSQYQNIKDYRYLSVTLSEKNNNNKKSVQYAIQDFLVLDSCMNNIEKFVKALTYVQKDSLLMTLHDEVRTPQVEKNIEESITLIKKKLGKIKERYICTLAFEQSKSGEKLIYIKYNLYWEKAENGYPNVLDITVDPVSKKILGFDF